MKKNCIKTGIMTILLVIACALVVFAEDTTPSNGAVTEDGVTHIYKNGKLLKNRYGYKVNDTYYRIDKKGAAEEVSEAQGLAGIRLQSIAAGKSKSAALKKAFEWSSKKISYSAVKKPGKKVNAADYYAVIGFKKKKGNCYVMAAVFYQMAKVLGYDAKFVSGKIPNTTGKKLQEHAWVTIRQSGKTYVYDPNFAYVYHTRQNNKNAASGFKMTYTKKKGVKLGQYRYYTTKGKLLK